MIMFVVLYFDAPMSTSFLPSLRNCLPRIQGHYVLVVEVFRRELSILGFIAVPPNRVFFELPKKLDTSKIEHGPLRSLWPTIPQQNPDAMY